MYEWVRQRKRGKEKMRVNVPWGCLELLHPLWRGTMRLGFGGCGLIHPFFLSREMLFFTSSSETSFLIKTPGVPVLSGSSTVGLEGLWNACRQWFLRIWVFWRCLELTLAYSAECPWLCFSFSEVLSVSFSSLPATFFFLSVRYFPYYFILIKNSSLIHLSITNL